MPDADEKNYLLAGGVAELERLRLQARVWESEAEKMLDLIPVQPGWDCLDLGCGAMGILEPLSKRVGQGGHVTGVDLDVKQLLAARQMVQENSLSNVEVLELDAFNSGLPAASYDLVHVRFVFAPVGRDQALLSEMLRLVRPGGVVAIQEPDATCWNCFPSNPTWTKLKEAILAAFRLGGGDFNAGQRTYTMLQEAGLEEVQVRASVIALSNQHPYMRLPIQFATSLRPRILGNGLLSENELDQAITQAEQIATDPQTFMTTFIVTQVWGRKPG